MTPGSKRTSVVLDAIGMALTHLEKMPDVIEVRAWRAKALAYETSARSWACTPPTAEQREAMMKHVVGLHVAVTKLQTALKARNGL